MERLEAEVKKRGCIRGGDLAFAFETGKMPQEYHPVFLVSTATGTDTSSLQHRPTILTHSLEEKPPHIPWDGFTSIYFKSSIELAST
ncbi:hypothetical protein [Paenibacillus glucanolyticus]|uniref:hypothetical protein n=1 Tax=Paenibacillus glucanolyticus TaxID=59843 RepID=UPI0018D44681|nr:hypothetical protein [Paenibacillus glucanolyticus]